MQGPNCGGPSLREGVQFDGTVAVLEHEFGSAHAVKEDVSRDAPPSQWIGPMDSYPS
jgi:hypothetical protein